ADDSCAMRQGRSPMRIAGNKRRTVDRHAEHRPDRVEDPMHPLPGEEHDCRREAGARWQRPDQHPFPVLHDPSSKAIARVEPTLEATRLEWVVRPPSRSPAQQGPRDRARLGLGAGTVRSSWTWLWHGNTPEVGSGRPLKRRNYRFGLNEQKETSRFSGKPLGIEIGRAH